MERQEFARLRPGASLWIEATGEEVRFRWITHEGPRCGTGAGDRTYWWDEVVDVDPRKAKAHKGRAQSRAGRVVSERKPVRVVQLVTSKQTRALQWLSEGAIELWYHDVGASTAQALLARGWVRESGNVRCARCTTSHPGALEITAEGRDALREQTGFELAASEL